MDKPVVAEAVEVVSALVEVADSDVVPVVAATVVVAPAVEEVPAAVVCSDFDAVVEVPAVEPVVGWDVVEPAVEVPAVEEAPAVEPVVGWSVAALVVVGVSAAVVVEAAATFEAVVVWPVVDSDVPAAVEPIETKCNSYLHKRT